MNSNINVLVTGANGQLGSEIRKKVRSAGGDRFLFTDVRELDVTDRMAVRNRMKQEQIDVVVNCAAYTAVDRAEEDEATADLLNRQAVENLAVNCRETGATLIHISTDYVFPGTGNLPYKEDGHADPLGVYGSTKLAGEQAVECSGCHYLIFRTAWLYSSFGNNFVKTIRRLSEERSRISVVFDQVGTPTYAADLAALILYILKSRMFLKYSGIYHFSNEGVCSWFDFAHEIVALSERNCQVVPCYSEQFPSKVKRPVFSVLDKTKVKTDFDWTIPYWRDSLIDCIEEIKREEIR